MIKAVILYVVSGLILSIGVVLMVKNIFPYIWPGLQKFQILEEW